MKKNNIETNRIDVVTYLKGVAIIMVIVCHVVLVLPFPPLLSSVGSIGMVGCQLFFMLSAFTLCLSYSRNAPTYGDFIKRRLNRIVPHYWGVLLIYIVIHLVNAVISSSYDEIRMFIPDILCNLFIVHGLVPDVINRFVIGGWYVGTIMLFYYLFPLLYKCWNAIGKRSVKIILILCLQLVNVAVVEMSGVTCGVTSFTYHYLPNQLPCLMTGFLLFDMYTDGSLAELRCPFLWFVLLFAGGCAIGFSQGRFSFDTIPVIIGFSFVFLFAFLYSVKPELTKNAVRRSVVRFGEESFGIYLIHTLIVFYLTPLLYQAVSDTLGGSFLIVLLFTAALYLASYWAGKLYNRLIERLKETVRRSAR